MATPIRYDAPYDLLQELKPEVPAPQLSGSVSDDDESVVVFSGTRLVMSESDNSDSEEVENHHIFDQSEISDESPSDDLDSMFSGDWVTPFGGELTGNPIGVRDCSFDDVDCEKGPGHWGWDIEADYESW